ncbi:hypothetical protein ACLOJK_009069 [Asimina triloba]
MGVYGSVSLLGSGGRNFKSDARSPSRSDELHNGKTHRGKSQRPVRSTTSSPLPAAMDPAVFLHLLHDKPWTSSGNSGRSDCTCNHLRPHPNPNRPGIHASITTSRSVAPIPVVYWLTKNLTVGRKLYNPPIDSSKSTSSHPPPPSLTDDQRLSQRRDSGFSWPTAI